MQLNQIKNHPDFDSLIADINAYVTRVGLFKNDMDVTTLSSSLADMDIENNFNQGSTIDVDQFLQGNLYIRGSAEHLIKLDGKYITVSASGLYGYTEAISITNGKLNFNDDMSWNLLDVSINGDVNNEDMKKDMKTYAETFVLNIDESTLNDIMEPYIFNADVVAQDVDFIVAFIEDRLYSVADYIEEETMFKKKTIEVNAQNSAIHANLEMYNPDEDVSNLTLHIQIEYLKESYMVSYNLRGADYFNENGALEAYGFSLQEELQRICERATTFF